MKRRAVLAVVTVLAVAGLAIAGCGGSSSKSTNPGGGGGGSNFNFAFPATGVSHSFQFMSAGTFNYGCAVHPSMNGTVVVDAGSANDSALVNVGTGGGSLVFSPSSVTIKPTGTVRWVNVSSMSNHTATNPDPN